MSHSNIAQSELQRAIDVMKKGGVVAFPTDTVYGLGVRADDTVAVRRVFELKGRPLSLALPLLVADIAMAEKTTADIPENARVLMKKFWPGALTLVFKKAAWVQDVVTAGSDTIALRMPRHDTSLALIKGVGVPLVGTSANVHGKPSPITAEEVREQLGGRVDFILDGGRTPVGVESTIVDVTTGPLRILREGALGRVEIEESISIL